MAEILIAEDSATQAAQIRMLLEADGFDTQVVGNGVEALRAIAEAPPLAVLTDLDMPEMNGLELVVAMRREYPHIPVVLMTAFGSEDIAVQSLQSGAASYVPKKNLTHDLVRTLRDVLEVSRARQEDARLEESLTELTTRFELPNLATQVLAVVGHIQEGMVRLSLGDETERLRLGVALDAAIQNAMYFGNLEFTPQQLQHAYDAQDGGKTFARLIHERSVLPPYHDRQVEVEVTLTRLAMECVIRHEGPGFSGGAAKDTDDSLELSIGHGRSWLLVRSFMGKLTFSPDGKVVYLSKRYAP